MTGEERNVKLAEYAAAHSSAEHFDSMSWTIKSVLWGANLVLFGFSVTQLAEREWFGCQTMLLVLLSAFVGMTTVVAACAWSYQCGKAIRYKYALCRRLEGEIEFGVSQHSEIVNAHAWSPGLGQCLTWLMSAVFGLVWSAVALLAVLRALLR
ncbi:MAG: hypothetical protein NTX69_06315 [Candidatus Bipolaricaulota bacterium]|nr:hypothetical protein [Candidatus Bipolaricaulota bacterium]